MLVCWLLDMTMENIHKYEIVFVHCYSFYPTQCNYYKCFKKVNYCMIYSHFTRKLYKFKQKSYIINVIHSTANVKVLVSVCSQNSICQQREAGNRYRNSIITECIAHLHKFNLKCRSYCIYQLLASTNIMRA